MAPSTTSPHCDASRSTVEELSGAKVALTSYRRLHSPVRARIDRQFQGLPNNARETVVLQYVAKGAI